MQAKFYFRIRYAGDIKDMSSLSPQEAQSALLKFKTQLAKSQKRNSRLKQQNLWLRKKLKKLNLNNKHGHMTNQVNIMLYILAIK